MAYGNLLGRAQSGRPDHVVRSLRATAVFERISYRKVPPNLKNDFARVKFKMADLALMHLMFFNEEEDDQEVFETLILEGFRGRSMRVCVENFSETTVPLYSLSGKQIIALYP
jgi:hypothetical protein